MQIDIQSRGFSLTEALENHAHNRLGFTFLHASSRVNRVRVRLSDLNGPRGGVDNCCLAEVRLEGLPVVIVKDVQSDMYTAIDRAVGRAAEVYVASVMMVDPPSLPEQIYLDTLARELGMEAGLADEIHATLHTNRA